MIEYLNELRVIEFNSVFREIDFSTKEMNVLEIGSGTGKQLTLLASRFGTAKGIEIQNSNYSDVRSEDIIMYDGVTIPFEDNTFDFIFTSNVLEHVVDIDHMVKEMSRVTKTDGYGLHVMPTHTWRFWTTLTGYLSILVKPFKKFKKEQRKPSNSYKSTVPKSNLEKVLNLLVQGKHGERGNLITEAYYFSPFWWKKTLTKGGHWTLINSYGNRLFYTGHNIFGNTLSWNFRKSLTYIFGNACHVYLIRKSKENS